MGFISQCQFISYKQYRVPHLSWILTQTTLQSLSKKAHWNLFRTDSMGMPSSIGHNFQYSKIYTTLKSAILQIPAQDLQRNRASRTITQFWAFPDLQQKSKTSKLFWDSSELGNTKAIIMLITYTQTNQHKKSDLLKY